MRSSHWLLPPLVPVLVIFGCSATDGGGGESYGATGGSGTAGAPTITVPIETDENGRPLNLGTEGECNGLDDNNNGIIDDVDVGKDGVCDCLAVATIGWPESPGASVADANVGSFTAWLEVLGSRPPVHLGDATITAESLAGIQVLIVQNIMRRAYSVAEIGAIAEWVNNQGGGVMTMAGYTASAADANNVNQILLGLGGIQYDLSSGGSGFLQSGDQSVAITQWNPEHPIAAGVTGVGVYYGYPVNVPAVAGADWVASHPGLGSSGIAGGTLQLGAGRIFVWSDEWITFTKDWTTRSDYNISRFLANTMMWLTPQNQCQVDIPDVVPME